MSTFTEQQVREFEPRKEIYEIFESDDFAIRVFPNGIKTWVLTYTVSGYSRRKTLGLFPEMSLDEAYSRMSEDVAQQIAEKKRGG